MLYGIFNNPLAKFHFFGYTYLHRKPFLKKFQVNYEQSEQGPALTGHPDELENVKLYISQAIHDENE